MKFSEHSDHQISCVVLSHIGIIIVLFVIGILKVIRSMLSLVVAFNLYNKTEQQILNHYPNIFQGMIFVKPNESKAKFLKGIDADIHIDDYDVEDSVMAGIETWLITNEETKYNHHLRNNLGLNQAARLEYVKGVSRKDAKWLV